MDDSLYEPMRVDFTPGVTATALAKGIAAVLIGFLLLMLLSLSLMARRVRKRGGYGRKAGAVLRSVYPVVLGLGGWFLGVLIMITTMPSTPLDDELLAVLSVGTPIRLGIYWAWVSRDRSPEAKIAGFALATGGALVGAWLGFNATDGLVALLTAIVGAVVAPNLLLLGHDIARDRQARQRVAASAKQTLDARPSTG